MTSNHRKQARAKHTARFTNMESDMTNTPELLHQVEASAQSGGAPAVVAKSDRLHFFLNNPSALDAFIIAAEKNAEDWLNLNREFAEYRAAPPAPQQVVKQPELLTRDEMWAVMEALEKEHNGTDFESECYLCQVYRKLNAALQSTPQGATK